MNDYCCFNCDSDPSRFFSGMYYKAHEGKTRWFIGLDGTGQAHYACEDCKDSLYNVRPLAGTLTDPEGAS